MVKFRYKGTFYLKHKSYEVILDETNKIVNIFYKGDEDVECYQMSREFVSRFPGKNLVERTKACWIEVLTNQILLVANVALQTFPLGFWEDIIKPVKLGKPSNLISVYLKMGLQN